MNVLHFMVENIGTNKPLHAHSKWPRTVPCTDWLICLLTPTHNLEYLTYFNLHYILESLCCFSSLAKCGSNSSVTPFCNMVSWTTIEGLIKTQSGLTFKAWKFTKSVYGRSNFIALVNCMQKFPVLSCGMDHLGSQSLNCSCTIPKSGVQITFISHSCHWKQEIKPWSRNCMLQ